MSASSPSSESQCRLVDVARDTRYGTSKYFYICSSSCHLLLYLNIFCSLVLCHHHSIYFHIPSSLKSLILLVDLHLCSAGSTYFTIYLPLSIITHDSTILWYDLHHHHHRLFIIYASSCCSAVFPLPLLLEGYPLQSSRESRCLCWLHGWLGTSPTYLSNLWSAAVHHHIYDLGR